jgi:hypothetical protein
MTVPPEFDRLRSFSLPPDPHALVEAARAKADRLVELRERLGDVLGRAATDDGYIAAACDGTGLRELTLEPRAMRLPSEDLAAAIVTVSRSAREDYDRQRRELLAETGAVPEVDLEQSRAQLAELQESFRSGTGDLQTLFERFRTQSGR